jgi:IclR helix-turn-helix domain
MADVQLDPLLRRLVHDPPRLEGGVALSAEPLDETHVQLWLRHEGHELSLRAARLSVPYPSGLRRLLAGDPEVEAVVVAHAPRGLAAAAAELGIGVLDVEGHGRLVGPGFVYVVPARQSLERTLPGRSSPFAPRASRVVRALLAEPSRGWRLSELARLLEVNPGNVHRALDALHKAGHVERDAERYVVVDPGSLLEAWADAAVQPRQRFSWPLEGAPLWDAVADVVERLNGKAVVSGELAAELLAPHLPAEAALVHCLDGEAWVGLQAVSNALGPPSPWHPASDRLIVDLPDGGVSHFGAPADGLPLVSPQQLYVDLVHAGGRAREAAEEVRRQRLGY